MRHFQDTNSTLDYAWDFSQFITGTETITDFVLTSAPSGLTFGTASEEADIVTALVSGGTYNTEYRLTCKATFSDGKVCERSHVIRFGER